MSIIRLPRRDRYAVISSACIEDKRLSWEARGLLIYLLSKKDNWQVKIKDLINQTKDCLGVRSGRDKVYKVLKELRTMAQPPPPSGLLLLTHNNASGAGPSASGGGANCPCRLTKN